METFTGNTGLKTVFIQQNSNQEMWRPWMGNETSTVQNKPPPVFGDIFGAKSFKIPQVIHPVKLFWPKSRCFDYLYQEAEMLLRCYPIQATICPYEDDSSSEEEEDEEGEGEEDEEKKEVEKEQN